MPSLDLKTEVNDVLRDMTTMATEAAKAGGQEAIALAKQAADLTADAIKIDDPLDKLQALESIGHGMKSGLAAIANRQAREALENILGRSLNFAKTLLGGVLGLLG